MKNDLTNRSSTFRQQAGSTGRLLRSRRLIQMLGVKQGDYPVNGPEFVSKNEVEHACKELGMRDWSTIEDIKVSTDEARAILKEVGGEARELELEDFREGLQIELEHGTCFPDANITNNHPVLTGKIVLAHLKESLLYYKRLAVVELEGDLLKAVKACDAEKARSLYQRMASARVALNQAEVNYLADTQ